MPWSCRNSRPRWHGGIRPSKSPRHAWPKIRGNGTGSHRWQRQRLDLDNVPDILGGMAKLTAGDARTETVIADADLFVDELIGKIIFTAGHGADEDTDALGRPKLSDVVPDSDHRRVEAQRDLATVRGEMVGDGILDDLEELLLRLGRSDREPVQ